MALWLIMIEMALIVTYIQILPQHVFFLVPISSVGIICHILLFVAVHKRSRWFILPWLIYAMLMVVGLSLAAVLFIVIPLGTYSHNWPWEITKTCISLSSAGLYLYFWIVVLELFIKMVPMPMIFDQAFGGPVPPPLPPGNYPMMYPNTAMYPAMFPTGAQVQQQQPLYYGGPEQR